MISKFSRIFTAVVKNYFQDNCDIKASALTYYTLLSIVPILAVAFGIAKGFGLNTFLETEILSAFKEQEQAFSFMINMANSFLENAKGGVIAGIGVLFLFWTNLRLLGTIEETLHDIWKKAIYQTTLQRFSNFFTIMILGPILIVAYGSLLVYIRTIIQTYGGTFTPYLQLLLQGSSMIVTWLIFAAFYFILVPHVKGHIWERVVATIMAGILFQVWQWIYATFQTEIFNYGVVYGAFAALPLFLIWLQISWLIVLIGGEIAAQLERDVSLPSLPQIPVTEKHVGLLILAKYTQSFLHGNPPITIHEISKTLKIPYYLSEKMIKLFEAQDLLREIYHKKGAKGGFQLGKDPNLFSVKEVLNSIEQSHFSPIQIPNSPLLKKISSVLKELDDLSLTSTRNLTLKELSVGGNEDATV